LNLNLSEHELGNFFNCMHKSGTSHDAMY